MQLVFNIIFNFHGFISAGQTICGGRGGRWNGEMADAQDLKKIEFQRFNVVHGGSSWLWFHRCFYSLKPTFTVFAQRSSKVGVRTPKVAQKVAQQIQGGVHQFRNVLCSYRCKRFSCDERHCKVVGYPRRSRATHHIGNCRLEEKRSVSRWGTNT